MENILIESTITERMLDSLKDMLELPIEELAAPDELALLMRLFDSAYTEDERPTIEVMGSLMHAAFVIGRWSREKLV